MGKGRVEAFSDGVIAIIITIMVLELKVPGGYDLAALRPVIPVFCAYVLSFVYVGIYWNNHHHMFHAVQKVNGAVLWANLHLLFWLSLLPAVTHWVGENHPRARHAVDDREGSRQRLQGKGLGRHLSDGYCAGIRSALALGRALHAGRGMVAGA
jgi:hypothetical protein